MNSKILAAPVLAAVVGGAAYLGLNSSRGRDTDMDGGGRGRDDEGNYLSVTTLFGKVDGDLTTVGDIASFAEPPGNYELVSNLAVHAVSAPDGFVTNILARRVAAEVPYTFGSHYGYDSWKQIFEVTLNTPIGDLTKGGTFVPSSGPVVGHVYLLYAERYEHYDPDTGMWVYDDSWSTNSYFEGDVTYTVHNYSYGSNFEYSFTAQQSDFSSEISVYGQLGGTASVSWYNSCPMIWDSGSIVPNRVINVIDNFLTEEEIKKVVPVIHEDMTSVRVVSNEVHRVEIRSNVVTQVNVQYHETTNRQIEVWREFSRDIAFTNAPVEHGTIFAGLTVTETNLTKVVPVIGTSPVVRVEAPYAQGLYDSGLFSAIQLGNFWQSVFTYRMQVDNGLWIRNPSCIRFYDKLDSSNEFDRCYSLLDVLNELDINAIRQELRSGYVSSLGGTYDADYSFNNLTLNGSLTSGSEQVLGNSEIGGTLTTAGKIETLDDLRVHGNIVSDGSVGGVTATFDEIQLPANSYSSIKFGTQADLPTYLSQLFANFRDNPYGLSTTEKSPVATKSAVLAILNSSRLKYPTKFSDGQWRLPDCGVTYTISTNFYYDTSWGRSTESQIFLNFPGVHGFAGLTPAPAWRVEELEDGMSFTLYVHSLPLGVVVYMPLRVYQYYGWTVRFTGNVLHEALGSGDMIRVFSCDDKTIMIEYNHSLVYTGE